MDGGLTTQHSLTRTGQAKGGQIRKKEELSSDEYRTNQPVALAGGQTGSNRSTAEFGKAGLRE